MSSLGQFLEELLKRGDLTDICVNGPEKIYVDRGAGLVREPGPCGSAEELRHWTLEQISLAGKSWDAKCPFVDATLPSKHRMHVAFPPLARQGILISLRRLADRSAGPSSEDRWSAITGPGPYRFLSGCVRNGDSILIAGATGSGKTTLASDLLGEVPAQERVLALEDTPELSPFHPHFVSLTSRPPNADGCGEVTLRTLLKQALRMRPDRIVLGECRGPEVLDLLQVLNTGHRGAIATLHANSPRDSLRRIELLCLLASGNLPLRAIRDLMALGIQWVVQTRLIRTGGQTGDGKRQISEIWRVEGQEGDTVLMRQMCLSTLVDVPHLICDSADDARR